MAPGFSLKKKAIVIYILMSQNCLLIKTSFQKKDNYTSGSLKQPFTVGAVFYQAWYNFI